MIGYGPESNHFVVELTYNYGVKSYDLGNDFNGITIKSKGIIDRAKEQNYPFKVVDNVYVLQSPDGYNFYVNDEEQTTNDPVQKVTINTNDLQKTATYWTDVLGITAVDKNDTEIVLAYDSKQTKLAFNQCGLYFIFMRKLNIRLIGGILTVLFNGQFSIFQLSQLIGKPHLAVLLLPLHMPTKPN